jgi:hypothetical protein
MPKRPVFISSSLYLISARMAWYFLEVMVAGWPVSSIEVGKVVLKLKRHHIMAWGAGVVEVAIPIYYS